MKLIPYLNFQGNCEEAVNWYALILNGHVDTMYHYDMPSLDVPDDYRHKVMHCQFQIQGNIILACDAYPGQTIVNGDGITLSIGYDDSAEAEKVFRKLAENGTIIMPFEQQFWGDHMGQVTDQYGKIWLVSTRLEEQVDTNQ